MTSTIKISQLPPATGALSSTDVVAAVQSGTTVKAPVNSFGYLPAGTGAVPTTIQAKLRQTVSVKDFGAVGDGTTDDTATIQAAMDYVSTSKQALFFPSGTYLISNSLTHITANELFENDPNNGIQMFGEEGSTIKASSSFPASNAMLNLDGNPTGSELVVAYCQQYNIVQNLRFDGSGVADRGIRLRAVTYGTFRNLELFDFKGNGLGVIHIRGVTTPTKDDADTTLGCLFEKVRIRKSASGYGVLGIDNRASQLTFVQCDIRDCFADAVRLAVAGAQFYACTFAGNGNSGQNTTGGLSIIKSQTTARNRGVAIHGCEFENNYWHEINIDYCFGFTITGCFGSPYQHSGALGQSWIRMGGEAAQGGVLDGNSTMDYSDLYSYNIRIYDVKAGASNISINNAVIQRSTAVDYLVNASATQITKNYAPLSIDTKPPVFSAYLATTNQTIASNTYTKINIDTIEFDTRNNFDVTQKRFTPSMAGYYQINGGMDFTPSVGATRAFLTLYKNGIAYKRFGDVSGSAGQVQGGVIVYMNGTTDYLDLYAYIVAGTSAAIAFGIAITFFNGSYVSAS